ncbi:MAG: SDR family NAD(P)-dependent oxidoreductase [Pseudomonadota bacterium]
MRRKTALVTGANRGIGRALAAAFVARGDRVIAANRGGASGPEGAETTPLDVTDDASLAALGALLENEALDLLVCNAGALIGRGGVDDPAFDRAAFETVLAVNVTGVFMTVRAALPSLRRARGKIAVISSQMGSSARPRGWAYPYCASKAAATNLAANFAVELKADGIAVGAYHPGWVRTDMGGPEAAVSPEESAAGLVRRFDALTVETAGCFEFFSGEPIPF